VKPEAEICYLEPGYKEDLKGISQVKAEGGESESYFCSMVI
jgi:hypothetical protein